MALNLTVVFPGPTDIDAFEKEYRLGHGTLTDA